MDDGRIIVYSVPNGPTIPYLTSDITYASDSRLKLTRRNATGDSPETNSIMYLSGQLRPPICLAGPHESVLTNRYHGEY